MKFIVNQKDLNLNPVLVSRGVKVGDSVETKDYTQPFLKLEPPVHEREYSVPIYTPKEDYKEPTLEETLGDEGNKPDVNTKLFERKPVKNVVNKKSASKNVKKSNHKK